MLLVSVIFVAALLVSCQHDFDDLHYTIVNESSEVVSFYFNNDPTRIYLYDDTDISFTINSGRGIQRPKDIDFPGHPRSIRMDTIGGSTRGFTYTFEPAPVITLSVQNTLSQGITIRAGYFINNNYPDAGFYQLLVPANGNAQTTIHTRTPQFTTNSPFPGTIVNWNINESTGVMYATIVVR